MAHATFSGRLEELPAALRFVWSQAEAYELGGEHLDRLELATEELVVNIMWHGYGGEGGSIDVTTGETANGGLFVEFRDLAPMFDPTGAAPPDLANTIEERQAGGLGIAMVRRLTSSLTYRREADANIVRIEMEAPK